MKSTLAYFVDDIPNGYRLQCQNCLSEHDYESEKWVCITCGFVIRYPLGASW